jgi:PST family polysaccharide transporter
LAWSGFGAWSLAVGRLAGNTIVTVMVIAFAGRYHFPGFDSRYAKVLLHQGLPTAGSTLLAFGLLNADYVIVGHTLGPSELGVYLLAFNVASLPVNAFASGVRRVSIAAFARLQAVQEDLWTGFTRTITIALAAAVPVATLIALLAPEIIPFVYGKEWSGAVGPLRWLALLGAIRVALDLSWDLMIAVGRSHRALVIHGLWLLVLVPALLAGVHLWGITGAGVAHLTVAVTVVVPLYLYSLKAIGYPIRSLLRPLVRPALGCVYVVVSVEIVMGIVNGPFVTLAVAGAVGTLGYLLWIAPMRHLFRNATVDVDPELFQVTA